MAGVEDPLFWLRWGIELRDGSDGDRPIVYVTGDIHGFNAHKVTELLMAYCRHDELILDLSGVRRFSPAGVTMLVSGTQFLAVAGCRLVLRRPSKTVSAVLHGTGTSERFEIEHGGIEQHVVDTAEC
jgi:anti-anti-sigma factor